GASGEVVRYMQQRLVTLGVATLATDGVFGPITEAAVKTYQTQQGLPVTGIVDVETGTRLEALVRFERTGTWPPTGWTWGGYGYSGSTALTDWRLLMSTNAAAIGSVGAAKLVAHRDVLPLFEGFLRDLAAGGYVIREYGSYNFRCTSTTTPDCYNLGPSQLSYHAWGAALDINWSANPLRTYTATAQYPDACDVPITTDFPRWVPMAAERWGLYWLGSGGAACEDPADTVSSVFRDTHHFEFRGTPAQAQAIVARNATVPRPAYVGAQPPPPPPASTTTTALPTATTTATTAGTTSTTVAAKPPSGPAMPVPLVRGLTGTPVSALQRALTAKGVRTSVSGYFGPVTEASLKRFQVSRSLPATGILDAATAAELGFTPTKPALGVPVRRGSYGRSVRIIQAALVLRGATLRIDGAFGPKVQAAVRVAQAAAGLPTTGIVDLATARALGLR
ncbi:MAG TPA: peptidoglycan-binding protein, partial [Acidimicrobiales bacterium]